jgi:hypothetical protein
LGRIHLQRILSDVGIPTNLLKNGCICKGKSSGQPSRSEHVDQFRAAFILSPKKTTQRASTELRTPGTRIWRVLHKRFQIRPYKVQFLQSLSEKDKVRRVAFCENFITQLEEDGHT